ncbi:outer membrane beta-barrel protein [Alteromonas antoniana]|uniref:outer membrane beta-barrel protein n=1 Tax=Alteromonas antoniana TaxID=2803813 RepID=UPI001C4863DB|nr:outer membrane beta-barrel protein [Alteromonas antoniana]
MFVRISGVTALFLIGTGPVLAQQAGRIEMDGYDLIPEFSTEMLYIDNVTYAADDNPRISSWVNVISPQITAVTKFSNNSIEAGYQLRHGEYFSSSADNYTDHIAHVTGKFEMNSRHRFTTKARYEDGHDERGRRYSNGFGSELDSVDTYKNPEVTGTYSFGSETSPGRIDLHAGYEEINYDNGALAYQIRDRSYKKVGGQFLYRVAGSTHLVLDATHQQIDYDVAANPENPLDSDETRVLAGVSWESSASTTGFAKVGYKEKSFEAPTRDTFTGVDWEVGMKWLPRSYSQFELSTSADTRETNGEGDYIRGQDYRLSWKHAWLNRFSTTMKLIYEQEDYEGAQLVDPREDDTTRALLSADYQFRRWLQLGVYYQFSERDSNRDRVTYDRNVMGLTARVTL